jgi:hypothetical protein
MPKNSLSNYGEELALAAVSSNLTGLYVGLYNTTPANGAGDMLLGEVTGANYGRQAVSFSAPAPSTGGATTSFVKNTAEVRFSAAGSGGWGTVQGIGIFTAATGGQCVWYGDLSGGSKIISQGDILLFEALQIELTMQ